MISTADETLSVFLLILRILYQHLVLPSVYLLAIDVILERGMRLAFPFRHLKVNLPLNKLGDFFPVCNHSGSAALFCRLIVNENTHCLSVPIDLINGSSLPFFINLARVFAIPRFKLWQSSCSTLLQIDLT